MDSQDYFFRSRIEAEIVNSEIEIPWREDPYKTKPSFSVLTIAALNNHLLCYPFELPGIESAVEVLENGLICYANFYTNTVTGQLEDENWNDYVTVAVKCRITDEYRVVIPEILLNLVQIKNEYQSIGMIEYFEIWSNQVFQKEKERLSNQTILVDST